MAARTQDDLSQLDIYVYDEPEENLYVHHDFLLPAMPLCLEWLDFVPSSSDGTDKPAQEGAVGNYIAVGTLDPEIEIWSLDVVDGLYPDTILGPSVKEAEVIPVAPLKAGSKKKKPKKPKLKASDEYHIDSILALTWNRTHRQLLASASADKSIKLWDLSKPAGSPAIRSFNMHTDKVQALQWNQAEPTILLSGSWDKTVRAFDSRSPEQAVGLQIECDVECVKWNTWAPHEFLVSCSQAA